MDKFIFSLFNNHNSIFLYEDAEILGWILEHWTPEELGLKVGSITLWDNEDPLGDRYLKLEVSNDQFDSWPKELKDYVYNESRYKQKTKDITLTKTLEKFGY